MARRPPLRSQRTSSTLVNNRQRPSPGRQSAQTLRAWYRNPNRNVRPVRTPRAPKAPAGPAASAAPAAPQYSVANLPPDAPYDAVLASLARQRDEQVAALTAARQQSLLDYGFQEGPSGALTFDPNNPMSKASVFKQTYDRSRRSSAQSMGSGGQLYSGAFQNQQDYLNRNQLQGEDAMQKQLAAFLARNTQGVTAARTGYETAAGEAYGDRIGRFQTNPLYDPAASEPPATNPTTPAAPTVQARRRTQPRGRRGASWWRGI